MGGVKLTDYKMTIHVTLMIYLMLNVLTSSSYCSVYDTAAILQRDLLQNYSKTLIPLLDMNKSLDVRILISFRGVLDFDVVSGILTTSCTFYVNWKDEKLTWIPGNYDGIKQINLPFSDVWTPNIVLGNGVESMSLMTDHVTTREITYHSNGLVAVIVGGITKTTCSPNVMFYPNDKHICTMQIGYWEVMQTAVNLSLNEDTGFLDISTPHAIWNVEEHTLAFGKVFFSRFLNFNLTIGRRPSFLILTMVVPMSILTFGNLIVFILPNEAGERMSFSMTILLTMSVYATIISDKIPNTSDPIAILTLSIIIKFIICASISLAVAIVQVVYHCHDAKPIPQFLIKLFAKKTNKVKQLQDIVNENEHKNPALKELNEVSNDQQTNKSNCDMKETCVTWKKIGRVCDLTFCFVFLVVIIIEVTYNMNRIMYRIE